MTEAAGARLRAAYADQLNPNSQRSVDYAPLRPDLSPEDRRGLGETLEFRQRLVSEHHNCVDPDDANGHPGAHRTSGCPYCFPPGRLGDYAAPEGVSAIVGPW